MQSLTKEEATLFMDGQTHYLRQVLRIVMSGDCPSIQSVLKSGGNCSGFQQLLDAIRGFIALRKRLTGPDFWKVLETPDHLRSESNLTREFGHLLGCMDPSSRRTFMCYFSVIETEVQRIWTPKMINDGGFLLG